MNNEPLVTVGTITGVVTALLVLLAAFGLPVTPEQQTAILGFVAVAAPFIVAVIARRFVSPSNSVVAQRLPDGAVVAGDASPIETGAPVEVVEPESEEEDDSDAEVIEPH